MKKILFLLMVWSLLSFTLPVSVFAASPKTETLPDTVLQQKIQEKFSKSKAGGGKFTVKVQAGVAYLSGKADVVQHKGAATRMAKTAGAKRVVNNIVVSEAAKQKATRDMERNKPRHASVRAPA